MACIYTYGYILTLKHGINHESKHDTIFAGVAEPGTPERRENIPAVNGWLQQVGLLHGNFEPYATLFLLFPDLVFMA